MAKGRSFGAKLAHEATNEGKVMCSVCKTEIKKVKLVKSKKSKSGTWAPKYAFVDMCKCNEKEILSGNV